MISAFSHAGLIKDSDFEIKVAQVGRQVLHVCIPGVKKEIRNWKKGKEKEVGTLGVRVEPRKDGQCGRQKGITPRRGAWTQVGEGGEGGEGGENGRRGRDGEGGSGRLGAKRGNERRWSWVSGGWALDVWALAKHVPRVPK